LEPVRIHIQKLQDLVNITHDVDTVFRILQFFLHSF